ncbi:MAG: GDSL-type esterase/lipase family protein [Planctomycetota bacterium]|jgi:lysophospholipase L1-like esterase|nr:GDSL-type esterase/lipase family protein [Planctomycetota bacterium]
MKFNRIHAVALVLFAFTLHIGLVQAGEWKKRIMAYGDSNTFGWFFNATGAADRYPLEIAWPGQLKTVLGDEYEVIVEGLGGRTSNVTPPIPFGSGDIPPVAFNGAEYIQPALSSHMPLDLVIIMLGTNDLRVDLKRQADDIAKGVIELATTVMQGKWQDKTNFVTPKVLIVSPTKLDVHSQYASIFVGSLPKTEALAGILRPLAEGIGAHFFDAATVVPFPEGSDQIHLNPANHATLGKALAVEVRKILK